MNDIFVWQYDPCSVLTGEIFLACIGYIKCDPVCKKRSYSLSKYPSLINHNSWSSKAITL